MGADAERSKKLLMNLLKEDGNKECADCNTKQPRWASTNLGVFVCIRCSGIHRNLGVHISKVKSVSLDGWPWELALGMKEKGNAVVNAELEADLPAGRKPTASDSVYATEQFIRDKYVARKWARKSSGRGSSAAAPTTSSGRGDASATRKKASGKRRQESSESSSSSGDDDDEEEDPKPVSLNLKKVQGSDSRQRAPSSAGQQRQQQQQQQPQQQGKSKSSQQQQQQQQQSVSRRADHDFDAFPSFDEEKRSGGKPPGVTRQRTEIKIADERTERRLSVGSSAGFDSFFEDGADHQFQGAPPAGGRAAAANEFPSFFDDGPAQGPAPPHHQHAANGGVGHPHYNGSAQGHPQQQQQQQQHYHHQQQQQPRPSGTDSIMALFAAQGPPPHQQAPAGVPVPAPYGGGMPVHPYGAMPGHPYGAPPYGAPAQHHQHAPAYPAQPPYPGGGGGGYPGGPMPYGGMGGPMGGYGAPQTGAGGMGYGMGYPPPAAPAAPMPGAGGAGHDLFFQPKKAAGAAQPSKVDKDPFSDLLGM